MRGSVPGEGGEQREWQVSPCKCGGADAGGFGNNFPAQAGGKIAQFLGKLLSNRCYENLGILEIACFLTWLHYRGSELEDRTEPATDRVIRAPVLRTVNAHSPGRPFCGPCAPAGKFSRCPLTSMELFPVPNGNSVVLVYFISEEISTDIPPPLQPLPPPPTLAKKVPA